MHTSRDHNRTYQVQVSPNPDLKYGMPFGPALKDIDQLCTDQRRKGKGSGPIDITWIIPQTEHKNSQGAGADDYTRKQYPKMQPASKHTFPRRSGRPLHNI